MAFIAALLGSILIPLLLRAALQALFKQPLKPSSPPPPSANMSLQQARAILGVTENASASDIQAAYLALMQKLHPDAGGNVYLATQLNQARDTLLNHIKDAS